jgi:hypothetical protein
MADSHVIPKGTITSMPRCLGCGFTVEKRGDVCAECAMKPQFQGKPTAPQATIVTDPQPTPAYQRADYQGGFARPQPRDIAEET